MQKTVLDRLGIGQPIGSVHPAKRTYTWIVLKKKKSAMWDYMAFGDFSSEK